MDIALVSGLAVAAVTVGGLAVLAFRPARDVRAHDAEEFFNFMESCPDQVWTDDEGHTYINGIRQPAAANNNWPGLTDDQQAVLMEMESERGFTAAHLSIVTHLPVAKVTKIRRELLSMGLADYGEMMDDDGALMGKSYCLTDTGEQIKAQLFARQAADLAA